MYRVNHLRPERRWLLLGSLRTNQSGFTLSEIIVTIVVAGIMLTSIASVFIIITTTQRRTKFIELATRTSTQKIENLRNEHYNSLTPGVLDFSSELPDELPAPRSATVTISEPEAGLRRLDVNVTFHDGSSDREVNLSTVIGNIGIAQ